MTDATVSPSSPIDQDDAASAATRRVPTSGANAPRLELPSMLPSRDDSVPEAQPIPVDDPAPIGADSHEHVDVRLAYPREATQQAKHSGLTNYADVLYRARLNARFVLTGETPGLRLRTPDHGTDARPSSDEEA